MQSCKLYEEGFLHLRLNLLEFTSKRGNFFLYAFLPDNEGTMRIQYKCLVSIYVFPEMKLRGLVISKT
jgi:hypothetical protein